MNSNILNQLNNQFESAEAARKKGTPTSNVWESLGYDKYLRPDVVIKRKEVAKLMDQIYDDLIPFSNRAEMPMFVIPMLQKIGINGF